MPRRQQQHATLARRQRIAAMYCRGLSQVDIARAEGISQPAVSQHLAAAREEWLAATQRDYGARVADELARLAHLEATAWAAYQRSCLPVRRGQTERPGDPRFLAEVFKCREAMLKLLGLLKGNVVQVNSTQQIDWGGLFRRTLDSDVVGGVPVDAVERRLAAIEAEVAGAPTPPPLLPAPATGAPVRNAHGGTHGPQDSNGNGHPTNPSPQGA